MVAQRVIKVSSLSINGQMSLINWREFSGRQHESIRNLYTVILARDTYILSTYNPHDICISHILSNLDTHTCH